MSKKHKCNLILIGSYQECVSLIEVYKCETCGKEEKRRVDL